MTLGYSNIYTVFGILEYGVKGPRLGGQTFAINIVFRNNHIHMITIQLSWYATKGIAIAPPLDIYIYITTNRVFFNTFDQYDHYQITLLLSPVHCRSTSYRHLNLVDACADKKTLKLTKLHRSFPDVHLLQRG